MSIVVIDAVARVASVLTRDSATMATYLSSDLGLIKTLLLQVRDYIPLIGGKLLILLHDSDLLAGS